MTYFNIFQYQPVWDGEQYIKTSGFRQGLRWGAWLAYRASLKSLQLNWELSPEKSFARGGELKNWDWKPPFLTWYFVDCHKKICIYFRCNQGHLRSKSVPGRGHRVCRGLVVGEGIVHPRNRKGNTRIMKHTDWMKEEHEMREMRMEI